MNRAYHFLVLISFSSVCLNLAHGDCDTIFPGTATFGFGCNYQCRCNDDRTCNSFGQCLDGCKYGWMGPGCQYRNVATDFKKAKQVGNNANANHQPENAVDGRHDTCSETSVTNYAGQQSWRIELKHDYEVTGLQLHVPPNSIESFREFRIETGPSSTYFPDLCYKHPNVTGTTMMEVICSKAVITRNLRIKLKLKGIQLRLCEIEIYGGRQVSFNLETKQSTTFSSMMSWKAVDGRFVTANDAIEEMEAATCSATNGSENNPWWYIDLEQHYRVQEVDFYGRLSTSVGSEGFHIAFGALPTTTKDVYIDDDTHSSVSVYQPRRVIFTHPLETKILKIDLRPYNTPVQLSVCELHVFADCKKNKCGWDCDKNCYCSHDITGTMKIEGKCPYGCAGRWTGVNGTCDTECDEKSWGEECQHVCGNCLDSTCDVMTGTCKIGCDGHWIPPLCTQECRDGQFGSNCKTRCGHCLNGAPCDKATGTCMQGCEPGWQGLLCEDYCWEGYFGSNCSKQCGRCTDDKPCDPVSGMCIDGCHIGFKGQRCDIDLNLLTQIKNEAVIRLSSVYRNWTAEGIHDGLFVDNPDICQCCAGTQNNLRSSLEIDLGKMYPITSVNVFGRENENKFEELAGFELHFANETFASSVLVYTNSIITNDTQQIHFQNILARFLTFARPGRLTICEVQIIEGECNVGYFGNECTEQCHCADDMPCDRESGKCSSQICDIGFTGASCSEACRAGTFGKNCANDCGHCLHMKPCDDVTGKCVEGCHPGYFGSLCKNSTNLIQRIKSNIRTEMSSTFQDWSSERAVDNDVGPDPNLCNCCSATLNADISWWRVYLGKVYPLRSIEVFGGRVKDSDFQQTTGFQVTLKNNSVEQGYLAYENKDEDDTMNVNIPLQNYLASIIEIKRPGKLVICELKTHEGDCPVGKYGDGCELFCHCADKNACDRNNGRCSTPACRAGWTGQACNKTCLKGNYGLNCSMRCGFCKDSKTCDHETGICHYGCANGYSGHFCTDKGDDKNVSEPAAVNNIQIEEGMTSGTIALYIILSLIGGSVLIGGGIKMYCFRVNRCEINVGQPGMRMNRF